MIDPAELLGQIKAKQEADALNKARSRKAEDFYALPYRVPIRPSKPRAYEWKVDEVKGIETMEVSGGARGVAIHSRLSGDLAAAQREMEATTQQLARMYRTAVEVEYVYESGTDSHLVTYRT